MRPQMHDEHPVHTRADWRAEVCAEDTQLGYWDWVFHLTDDENVLPFDVSQRHSPFNFQGATEVDVDKSEMAQMAIVLDAVWVDLDDGVRGFTLPQIVGMASLNLKYDQKRITEVFEKAHKRVVEIKRSLSGGR